MQTPNQTGTLELLVREFAQILFPLKQHFERENVRSLFSQLGTQFPTELLNHDAFIRSIDECSGSASALLAVFDQLSAAIARNAPFDIAILGHDLLNQIKKVITAIGRVSGELRDLSDSLPGLSPSRVQDFAQSLSDRLVDQLVVSFLETRLPATTSLLELIGILDRIEDPGVPGDITQPPHIVKDLHPERIGQLLSSPAEYIETIYGLGRRDFDGQLFLAKLKRFFDQSFVSTHLTASAPRENIRLETPAFDLQVDPAVDPPGLILVLKIPIEGGFDMTFPLRRPEWSIRVETRGRFAAGVQANIRPPAFFSLTQPTGLLEGHLGLTVLGSRPSPAPPFVLLGQTGASRLQVESVKLGLGFAAVWDAPGNRATGEPSVQAELNKAAAVIDTSQGSGLIAELAPGLRVEAGFDLRATWKPSTGLRLEGSSNLEARIPTNISVGPVSVGHILLGSSPSPDGIPIEISAGLNIKHGPVNITIDRVGLELIASFPPVGRNLGPLHFEAKFKPPEGLGLVIDGGGFKGGGFLRHTSGPSEQYSGALLLKHKKVSIGAFGVFEETSSGQTSFAIILGARFSPGFALGFGFVLTGVGGVIAINRAVDLDKIRARLASGTAGNLFFTDDPVANAPRLLGDLAQLMPAADGVHVIGPTVQVIWSEIAKFDVAVLIELPGPSKVVIVGSARIELPREEDREEGSEPAVRIRIDLLGEIDFARQHIQLDASLVDSTLIEVLKLTGDAAFQADAGDRPYSMLAIGGFHPAFNPEPAVFRKLNRIAITYETGRKAKLFLSLEAYLAITSNTFQLGATLSARITAGNVTAEGSLGFDALIQFKPFQFTIDFSAKVRIKYRGHRIAGVSFKGTITGPGPLVISGKFCFGILFFDFCWKGTFEIGGSTRQLFEPVASLADALTPELSALANLSAAEIDDLIVLKPGVSAEHFSPASSFTWTQKKAPLKTVLDRVGGTPLAGKQRAEVTVIDPTILKSRAPVLDWFSPGSFRILTQSEALNARAFDRLDSGITFDLGDEKGTSLPRQPKYDTWVLPQPAGGGGPPNQTGRLEHGELLLDAISGRTAALSVFTAPAAVTVTNERFEVRSQSGALLVAATNEADAQQRAAVLGAVAVAQGDVISLGGVL